MTKSHKTQADRNRALAQRWREYAKSLENEAKKMASTGDGWIRLRNQAKIFAQAQAELLARTYNDDPQSKPQDGLEAKVMALANKMWAAADKYGIASVRDIPEDESEKLKKKRWEIGSWVDELLALLPRKTPTLLPCPFCGEEPKYTPRTAGPDGEWPETISCPNCPITLREGENGVEDVVRKWNRREGV